MSHYVLSIDQGTTGTTAFLMDAKTFKFVDKVNEEYKQIYPYPGQVEHNLNDIWDTVRRTTQYVLQKNGVDPKDVACIGITNQRETTCAFDQNGSPLAHAIVWQDRRTIDHCLKLKKNGLTSKIRKKTGLPIDPYFSATKMSWLLQNNDQVKAAAKAGNLHFGTIDTYLLFRLTGGGSFFTEPSNASRTLLMNLETFQWDKELLKLFKINENFLPQIIDSIGVFGKTKGLEFLPDGIPITGVLGDQQSALFGQAALKRGEMKCTYGTGAFMLINTDSKIVRSKNGLLSTAFYGYKGKKTYALEGSSYIAGAAVQWLRDNLKLIERSSDIESLANNVHNLKEMENILFLPFFSGLASPHWKPEAKGAIIGLTRDSGPSQISRACLEGVAFSINDLFSAMKKDTGLSLKSLNVDGGMVANNLFLQIQSDVLKTKIIRPRVIETTAYGASLAASIGSGILKFTEVKKSWQLDSVFSPQKSTHKYFLTKKEQWKQAIKNLYL